MSAHGSMLEPVKWWPRIRPWIALQELPKHLANLLPFLLGTTLAYWTAGSVDWPVTLVALAALFFLTDGTYIANEYFDYETDRANLTRIGGAGRVGVTTTGGTRVLVHGLIPRRHALVAAVVSFAVAVPLGIWLQLGLDTGRWTAALGLLGIFIGWFYSAPPIRASYRGLGEIFIAIGQGLVVFGAYYVQRGFDPLPLIVALPWFVALPALKIIREFPDYESDAAGGKRGLTQRLGRARASRLYALLILIALISFVPATLPLRSPLSALAFPPMVLLARSGWIMWRGKWRDARRLETAAVSGFTGMLLIPLALAVMYLISALLAG